jgi:hypothetical protein
MHTIRWRFQPRPSQVREFESVYGPEGEWVRLFRQAPGFLGATLRPHPTRLGWYETEDRWESLDAWHAFRRAFSAQYTILDEACRALTTEEFEVVHESDGRGPAPRGPAAG